MSMTTTIWFKVFFFSRTLSKKDTQNASIIELFLTNKVRLTVILLVLVVLVFFYIIIGDNIYV